MIKVNNKRNLCERYIGWLVMRIIEDWILLFIDKWKYFVYFFVYKLFYFWSIYFIDVLFVSVVFFVVVDFVFFNIFLVLFLKVKFFICRFLMFLIFGEWYYLKKVFIIN